MIAHIWEKLHYRIGCSTLSIIIFANSDYRHDQLTGKSRTGIETFVDRPPIIWSSTILVSVQTSTFSTKFVALRKSVEEALTSRYYLWSMGLHVTKPSNYLRQQYVFNQKYCWTGGCSKLEILGIIIPLWLWTFQCRYCQYSKFNFADSFTKTFVSTEHHLHYSDSMKKQRNK